MSLWLYFKPQTKTTPSKNGLSQEIFGMMVYESESPEPHVIHSYNLPETTSMAPEWDDIVTKISYRGSFGSGKSRIDGEYHLGTAFAVLEYGPDALGKNHQERLTIVAQRKSESDTGNMLIADASALYTLIRAGKIHPEVSYENPTVPAPIRHVRRLIKELWEVIKRDISLWWFEKTRRFQRA